MDNQKSTEGKGSDASREGLGSNIGKSQNAGLNQGSSASSNSQSGSSGSLGSANASPSTAKPATGSSSGSIGGTSNAGSLQSSSQSSGNLGSQQSNSPASSAAGSSGSIGSASSGNSALGSSGSSQQSSDSDQSATAAQAAGGIKGAIASLNADNLHQSIDKAGQAAQPLVDRLVSTAHAGVDRVSSLLSGASETIGQRKGQLGETYSNYSEKGTEYVKTNPGTALLVAGAVGFLLAKLLSSSDKREYRYYRD